MITENDLQISNKSYINKDFPVIYNEIMDLAKKLSYKFDPETSNESDPFVVILKLLAFIGDKMNYNVDKNVLERFMPSATQESSMRDLCSMMGYNVKYYIAPTTSVTFKYVGGDLEGKSFVLKKLDTILTDDENEVSFVTTRDVSIYARNEVTDSVPVIQGVVKTLTTLTGEVVRLENLDDNLRIYFPEKMVAQNGVFIDGGTIDAENEWTYVDNLNVTPPNSYVYTFGYDSTRRLPYLQFPDDIASLIGSGLTIRYVLTTGVDGNIKARTLTKISSPTSVDTTDGSTSITLTSSDGDNLIVKNINASINGNNPESIDVAYSNFKKTVGTFDTLVTCRDYMNYIYNLKDVDEIYPLVSNVLVADRRNDYNYSNNIVTYNQYGQTTINAILLNGDDEPEINAFDLILYTMNPIKTYDTVAFENSFRHLGDNNEIEAKLEESKCVSHDYKQLKPTDVFAFKNYYKLDAKISTTYKVNAIERADILNNVNQALIKNFNAREVDFGYEIPYDILLRVIENADVRIKIVSLAEPELETFVMYADDSEESLFTNNNYLELIAKNVLSGKAELFDYNELFNYDFGQQKISGSNMLYNDVIKVTSEVTLNPSTTGVVLKSNEVAQFITPSLITDVTYPYGINYYLKLNGANSLTANEEYQLQSGEYCILIYTDTNSNQVVVIYKGGDIIKTSTDLNTTKYEVEDLDHTQKMIKIKDNNVLQELRNLNITDWCGAIPNADGYMPTFMLGTQETLEHRILNEEVVDYPTYLYWSLNNEGNELMFDADGEYMLEEGEYLFKTDASFSDLISYGSGTVIKLSDDFVTTGIDWHCSKVSLEDISEDGILGMQDKFKYFDLDSSVSYFTMKEQIIYTAIEGDEVKSNDDSLTLDNDFVDVEGKEISINGEFIPSIAFGGGYVKGRSRLDIGAGPTIAQTLQENQTMEFTYLDSDDQEQTTTLGNGDSFNLSTIKQLGGGVDVDLRTINYLVGEDDEHRYINNDMYCYDIYPQGSLSRNASNYSSITLASGGSQLLTIPAIVDKKVMIMVYSSSDKITISSTGSGGTVKNYYTNDVYTNSKLNEGINIIELYNIETLTLTNGSSDSEVVVISKPRIINDESPLGYNPSFNLSSAEETTLRGLIQARDVNSEFYYTNYAENAKLIESDNYRDPHMFYDYNNVANKWTISEIDFSNSKIDIVRSSRV